MNNELVEATKQICENGDLTHDYAISLAQMVVTRDEEIKRLLNEVEQLKNALSRATQLLDRYEDELG